MYLFCGLQSPFNQLTYKIIGDGKATVYFRINSNNGDVILNRSLSLDTDPFFIVSTHFQP